MITIMVIRIIYKKLIKKNNVSLRFLCYNRLFNDKIIATGKIKIVGASSYSFKGVSELISFIFVDANFRKQRISKKISNAIFKYFKENNYIITK